MIVINSDGQIAERLGAQSNVRCWLDPVLALLCARTLVVTAWTAFAEPAKFLICILEADCMLACHSGF